MIVHNTHPVLSKKMAKPNKSQNPPQKSDANIKMRHKWLSDGSFVIKSLITNKIIEKKPSFLYPERRYALRYKSLGM